MIGRIQHNHKFSRNFWGYSEPSPAFSIWPILKTLDLYLIKAEYIQSSTLMKQLEISVLASDD